MNLSGNLQLIFELLGHVCPLLNNQLSETARDRQIARKLDQPAAAMRSQKLARPFHMVERDVFQIHRNPLQGQTDQPPLKRRWLTVQSFSIDYVAILGF